MTRTSPTSPARYYCTALLFYCNCQVKIHHSTSASTGIIVWEERQRLLLNFAPFWALYVKSWKVYNFSWRFILSRMHLNPNDKFSHHYCIFKISMNLVHIRFTVDWDVLYKSLVLFPIWAWLFRYSYSHKTMGLLFLYAHICSFCHQTPVVFVFIFIFVFQPVIQLSSTKY